MIRHIFATPAGEPKNKDVKKIGIVAAGVFLIAAVWQSVSLIGGGIEDGLMTSFLGGLGMGDPLVLARVLTGFLIFFELFAIPFVLGMKTSVLMRVTSMINGWISTVTYLVIVLGIIIANYGVTTLKLSNMLVINIDWLFLCYVLIFAMVVALITWNRWPKRDFEATKKYFAEGKRKSSGKTTKKKVAKKK